MGKNQGLIITLIMFIILALALGVLTYFMAQGYKEIYPQMTQAVDKANTAESEVRKLNVNIDQLKEKIGYPALEASQILQKMTEDIKNSLPNVSGVPNTYKDAVTELGRNLLSKNDEIARYKKQSEDYRVLAENEVQKSRTQLDSFNDQRKAADDAFAKQKADDSKKLLDLEQELREQIKKTDRIKLEAKKLNDKYLSEASDAEEVAGAIAEINTGLSTKLDQMNKADFDVPDAAVLYVNQSRRTVRLNIGSVEGVRPLIGFSVYPKDTFELGSVEPKGTVEIVRIIGDHESEARIVDDLMENPIMPGDILYTPLWMPGEKIIYALNSGLDVDGDGREDLELIKNLIESAGGEVAYWVDAAGVHGQLSPGITAIITPNNSDPKKDPILGKAMQNNIRVIKLAEFLRKIHYKPSSYVSQYNEEGGLNSAPAPTDNGNGFNFRKR